MTRPRPSHVLDASAVLAFVRNVVHRRGRVGDAEVASLRSAGFGDGEINKAFDWLEDLSDLCDPPSTIVKGGTSTSIRHFSPEEQTRFDAQAQSLLLKFEQTGILDPETRELVIDRIMALETAEIDTEHLKWVIMMVLCNRPGHEDVVAWAEDLIIDRIEQHIH